MDKRLVYAAFGGATAAFLWMFGLPLLAAVLIGVGPAAILSAVSR